MNYLQKMRGGIISTESQDIVMEEEEEEEEVLLTISVYFVRCVASGRKLVSCDNTWNLSTELQTSQNCGGLFGTDSKEWSILRTVPFETFFPRIPVREERAFIFLWPCLRNFLLTLLEVILKLCFNSTSVEPRLTGFRVFLSPVAD